MSALRQFPPRRKPAKDGCFCVWTASPPPSPRPTSACKAPLRQGDSPGEAVWSRGAEQQRYSSLDALLTQSLGTTLPVSTVLDWLDGRAVALDGWDLVSLPSSDLPLVARRRFPAPTLELRLRLTP